MKCPRPKWALLGPFCLLISATACAHSRESFSFFNKKPSAVAAAPAPKSGKVAQAPAPKRASESNRIGFEGEGLDDRKD